MTDLTTRKFYDEQARGYAALRSRPIQLYTDKLERAVMKPLVEQSADILDLGCGEGRLTRWIAEEKRRQGGRFSVHGADFSPGMVAAAKASNGDLPASYGVGDAMALPYEDNSYDLVVSCTAPNNFPSLDGALDEIRRVLRPGGIFCATIINSREAARFARYIYYSPYYLYQLGRRVILGKSGYHRVLFSRDELTQLFQGRFEIVELTGLRLLPDFVPEFPLNVWPPLFPIMSGLIRSSEKLDGMLASNPSAGSHARFHLVVARAVKPI